MSDLCLLMHKNISYTGSETLVYNLWTCDFNVSDQFKMETLENNNRKCVYLFVRNDCA